MESGRRLLTLIGPGGVGKTRLALRIAQQAAEAFADGVVFVPLATVSDPDLVLPAIGRALGLREDAARAPAEWLAEALRNRHRLLVLDNVEHVSSAANLLAALLAACPGVAVLVTSRAALRIAGEQRFPVRPLALPPPAEGDGSAERPLFATIAASPAVQLFVARAQAVDPQFMLDDNNAVALAAICRRLDGLPLAIELAAARMHLLSPVELLDHLDHALPFLTAGPDDAPDRLRTMRQTIAWSYDLLASGEQVGFRQLAIFVGGFTLPAAERVLRAASSAFGHDDASDEAIGSSPRALPLVSSLIDKSLLHRCAGDGESRFAMLETVREFARDRLDAAGEAEAVAQRHAAYYVALAEGIAPAVLPGDPVAELDRLGADHDNLRAAFDWLRDVGAAEACLRLAAACGPFWFARGHLREGWTRLSAALAAGSAPTPARGRALVWAIEFALPQGNRSAVTELGQEAVAIWRTLDDPRGLAAALHALATVLEQQQEWAAATTYFEEELALRRRLGEPLNLGITLLLLGGIAFGQSDTPRAIAIVDEAAALLRTAGNRRWLGLAAWYLGLFAASQQQVFAAARHYRDSLWILSEIEEVVCRFKPLVGLAAIAAESGRPAAAARLLGASERLLRDDGMQLYPFDRPAHELAAIRSQAALGPEGFAAAFSAGQLLASRELRAEADAIVAAAERERTSTASAAGRPIRNALTPRERDVVRLLIAGNADKEIAAALGMSRRTVSNHVAAIRDKLGAPSRTAAATTAVRDDLV